MVFWGQYFPNTNTNSHRRKETNVLDIAEKSKIKKKCEKKMEEKHGNSIETIQSINQSINTNTWKQKETMPIIINYGGKLKNGIG